MITLVRKEKLKDIQFIGKFQNSLNLSIMIAPQSAESCMLETCLDLFKFHLLPKIIRLHWIAIGIRIEIIIVIIVPSTV